MMTRRTAFRQCDVARAIRAAKAEGAGRVVVQLDGTLAIELEPAEYARAESRSLPPTRRRDRIVL